MVRIFVFHPSFRDIAEITPKKDYVRGIVCKILSRVTAVECYFHFCPTVLLVLIYRKYLMYPTLKLQSTYCRVYPIYTH